MHPKYTRYAELSKYYFFEWLPLCRISDKKARFPFRFRPVSRNITFLFFTIYISKSLHKAVSRNFAHEIFAVQHKTYSYLHGYVSYDIRKFSNQAHTCTFAALLVRVMWPPSCVAFKISIHISGRRIRRSLSIRFHRNVLFRKLFVRGLTRHRPRTDYKAII